MSLARVDEGFGRHDFPRADLGAGPDDRLPPQDVHAEQSVLGGMLLSKDAIADCLEVTRGVDFYRPAHELIYDAILDLYGRGEPADAITVADELTKRGDLARIGGQAYLHQLISAVPTAANASYYATIVAERAVLRRLVDAGTRIVQMGYGQGGDVEDIVNAAQAEVYGVVDKRGSEDYHILGDLLEATADEIEHASGRSGEMVGVPTGFVDLDELTNGLHAGQMVVIAARPAMGKALALDTPLPTPSGWTTMGEVAPGDEVIGADGRPTRVVAATEVLIGRPCFEVVFCDGSRIVADEQHQWLTEASGVAGASGAGAAVGSARTPQAVRASEAVRTTGEIARTLRCRPADGRYRHRVRPTGPLQLPEADLPVGPYTLGVRLAQPLTGGAVRPAAPADIDVVMQVEAEGETDPAVDGVVAAGRIPGGYLRAGEHQRRRLLAGLLDAGGEVTPDGRVRFGAPSAALAEDVRELVAGLGHSSTAAAAGAGAPPAAWVTFAADGDVFGVEAKRLRHKEARMVAAAGRGGRRITAVTPVRSVPVRCIQVEAADHLYLAGRAMIPTHNSTLALDIARAAAIRNNLTTVVFSLEMSKNEITMRCLSAEASIQLQHMRKGTMRDEDWQKLARTMGEVSEAPLFIDDSPNMSLMEIRAKCRRLKQRHNLKLVIIDYLQLMSSGKRVESRQQEVSEFSRALKLLAKELELPVVALSQLNRGPEQRTDKRPQVSDLRESGCLTADTRVLRADTGVEVSLGQLHAAGARDVPVWALDESLRYVRRHLTHVFPTGTRQVYRLTTASGRTLRATANHPFLTYGGWRPLGELTVGDRVAVPRHVSAPEVLDDSWSEEDIRAAGLLVAADSEARIPPAMSSVPKRQLALFLRELFTHSGGVVLGAAHAGGEVFCFADDRARLDRVALLLLRFGIVSAVTGDDGGWVLDIVDIDSQRRFLQEIGIDGVAAGEAARLLDIVRVASAPAGPGAGRLPLWQEVAGVIGAPSSGEALPRLATVLEDAGLDLDAVNDITWDVVVVVEPDGVEQVYDATVLGTHNFIANGIAVHNSIEQDADIVMLLHRESLYEPDSPREGEADIIVAKHRNGPTKTVTVAFQGHYSRFTNMAASF